MSSPGSAKASEKNRMEFKANEANDNDKHFRNSSPWKIWTQVLIAELLNVLEGRRYDVTGLS
jgi:hypothetical protein